MPVVQLIFIIKAYCVGVSSILSLLGGLLAFSFRYAEIVIILALFIITQQHFLLFDGGGILGYLDLLESLVLIEDCSTLPYLILVGGDPAGLVINEPEDIGDAGAL